MQTQTVIALLLLAVILFVIFAFSPEQEPASSNMLKAVDMSVTWLDGSNVTSIEWGTVDNGTATLSDPFNISNIRTMPFTLQMNASNLSASIITLALTWNYTGATVNPADYVIVMLNQTVTAKALTFSYDVNIYATAT